MFLDEIGQMDTIVIFYTVWMAARRERTLSFYVFYRFPAVREPLKEGTDLYTVTLSADL